MLGVSEKHEPLDYRVGPIYEDMGVLDLRMTKGEEGFAKAESGPWGWYESPPSPKEGKAVRPFKAYPKELLGGASGGSAYSRFREEMLARVRGRSGGKKRPASPPQKPSSSSSQDEEKDAAYWERRRKNNEAAKRSRDARRAREDEITIRAAFLEQENMRLRYQLAALSDEAAKLRSMIYPACLP